MRTIAQRFWAKVKVKDAKDCWEWTAYRLRSGYGWFAIEPGVSRGAHRVSAVLHGLLPAYDDPQHVLHKCDNPRCVNPAHLFVGTNADNVADRVSKNRTGWVAQRGETNGSAKLRGGQVIFLRGLYASGLFSQSQLGAAFGIQQPSVHKIVRGQRWGHYLENK